MSRCAGNRRGTAEVAVARQAMASVRACKRKEAARVLRHRGKKRERERDRRAKRIRKK